MRNALRTTAALSAAFACSLASAHAGQVLFALGDSVTFGEDDLVYTQSDGDRGYVDDFADYLERTRGEDVIVRNTAIDGETADSFMDGTGRTPPVVGRTDDILALQNTTYSEEGGIRTQEQAFRDAVAEERAAGNTVGAITITLGFNELAALASMPTAEALAAIPATLATYEENYRDVLGTIREVAPDADLFMLGYYNPFPADPDSPAAPIFNEAGDDLNAIIMRLAGEFDARFVDVAPRFVGNEADFTFLDEQPAGFVLEEGMFPGLLPIGNVHATEAGYDAIAAALIEADAIPLPAAAWLFLTVAGGGAALRRRAAARA